MPTREVKRAENGELCRQVGSYVPNECRYASRRVATGNGAGYEEKENGDMTLIASVIKSKKIKVLDMARAAGISRVSMSDIVHHGKWLKGKDAEEIIASVRGCFVGISERRYRDLWDEIRGENICAVETALNDEIKEAVMISALAKKRFNIVRDPFVDEVRSAEDVYISKEHGYIRQSMYQTAKHGGFLAVVGESGSGKSTLRRDLLGRIADEGLAVAVIQPRIIDKRRLTAQSICEAIMCDVAPSVRPKRSLETKARQIEQVLTHSSRTGTRHVLIIEEAHDLAIQTLKYLKRFWEMEDGFTRLLSIILIGQPEMRYQLDEGRNYDAREVIRRIEVAQLMPLDKPGQVERYLELKFRRCGCVWGDIGDDDVGSAVREKLTRQTVNEAAYSTAYPLIINNVIKRALNTAADLGAKKIDGDIVLSV